MKGESKIITILGPTATGKSDLAVKIAKRFNGEIISADSRQVYKGLDIGTGKITEKEMKGVRHYLLSIASPLKTFTVADYQKIAGARIRQIIKTKKVPIVCGGTGLYIDSLIYDYALPRVKPDPKLRKELEKLSPGELFEKLGKMDPERSATIDQKNKRRLVRALEIVIKTKKPVEKIERRSPYQILKIGIKFPKEELVRRICKRLEKRIGEGMIEEAKKLKAGGLSYKRMEELGLEYKYLSRFLKKELAQDEMIQKLKTEIWRYAKRQMTWFKRDKEIYWIKNISQAEKLVNDFLKQ